MRVLTCQIDWPRTYRHALSWAIHTGDVRASRAGPTHDLGPTTVGPLPIAACDFAHLQGRPRDGRTFALLERLCYLGGIDPNPVVAAAPHYGRFRWPDALAIWPGAYGPRLANGLMHVVHELAKNPHSRRAVAGIWGAGTHSEEELILEGSPDVPCTLSLAFYQDPSGALSVHAIMRSTDLWMGLYYDLPAFAWLARAVAQALDWPLGDVTLTTTSLHLYARDAAAAKAVGSMAAVSLPPGLPRSMDDGPALRWTHLRRWARAEARRLGAIAAANGGSLGAALPGRMEGTAPVGGAHSSPEGE